MPRSVSRLRTVTVLVAVVSLTSLTVVYVMGLRVTAYNHEVIQHSNISAGLERVLITLLDAETGQRGYLLTGDEAYLEPYHAALQRLDKILAELDGWRRDGRIDPELAAKVEQTIDARLAALREAAEARRSEGLEGTVALIRSDRGKRLMDELRSQIGQLQELEQAELLAAEHARDRASQARTLTTTVLTCVTLGFLTWAYLRLRAEMSATDSALQDVSKQRELLEVTLTSIGDAVLVTDAEGRVSFVNREAERLTGWTNAEAAGRPLSEVFHIINEATRQTVESPVEKVLRLGQVVGLANHTLLVRRDGTEIPIDDSGAPVRAADGRLHGVVLVFRDFSAQRIAQRALEQSEARFRSLANAIPQLAWMARSDGHIFWFNERWHEYTGQDLPAVEGWGWESVVEPEHRPVVRRRWTRSLETGEPFDMEFPIRGAGGKYRWFLTRIMPLREASGNVVMWFGTSTDIDEKREQEAALHDAKISAERAKSAAEQASAAKDRFLAVLSHELRTPLTPVLTAVSLLERRGDLPAEVRETIELVHRNVELEARLIDDLLDLSRVAQGKISLNLRRLDLRTIVQQAVEVCRPDLVGRDLRVTVEVGPDECCVEGDAARLQQVVWNLLKNAVKFTPDGGRIVVRCLADADRSVVLEIADTGVGIDPSTIHRIFDAFEQGDPAVHKDLGGLGLGLAISKSLVELHRGTISAWSDGKAKGATFRVWLPGDVRSGAPAGDGEASLSAAEPNAETAQGLRVLLVEDHRDTARMVQRILELEGHAVTWTASIATALEAVDAQPFDLVISDLGLPDGTGLELMRNIRAKGLQTPAIALSGYGQEEDLAHSRRAGFTAHVVKPMHVQRLLAVLAEVTRGSTA